MGRPFNFSGFLDSELRKLIASYGVEQIAAHLRFLCESCADADTTVPSKGVTYGHAPADYAAYAAHLKVMPSFECEYPHEDDDEDFVMPHVFLTDEQLDRARIDRPPAYSRAIRARH